MEDRFSEILEHHCLADDGLLSQFRPYEGSFPRRSLDAVLQATRDAAAASDQGKRVTYGDLSTINTIVDYVERIAVEPGAVLVRDSKLTDEEHEELRKWLREMKSLFAFILGALADRDG